MQAVFTSKNKGFSDLYDQKFKQSYTILQDGIPTANRVAHSDRCLPNNLVTITSWLSIREL